MNRREKWNRRFMNIADEIATWSKDPDNKVGAVLVTIDNRILSTGYNGLPTGLDFLTPDKQDKLFKTVHAEVNCLIRVPTGIVGTTMIVTRFPCAQCAAQMIQAGVTCVTCRPREPESSWSDSMNAAFDMFDRKNVRVTYL